VQKSTLFCRALLRCPPTVLRASAVQKPVHLPIARKPQLLVGHLAQVAV
jgi:hypothetical protein